MAVNRRSSRSTGADGTSVPRTIEDPHLRVRAICYGNCNSRYRNPRGRRRRDSHPYLNLRDFRVKRARVGALRVGSRNDRVCTYPAIAACFSVRSDLRSVPLYTAALGAAIPVTGLASVCIARMQRRGRFLQLTAYQAVGSLASTLMGLATYLATSGSGIGALLVQSSFANLIYYGILLSTKDRIVPTRRTQPPAKF